MKKFEIILMAIALYFTCSATSSAQVAVRADVGMLGYNTLIRNPLQITTIPGLGLQLGADYDIHLIKSFYLTPGLYWSYRTVSVDPAVEDVYGFELLQEHFLNIPVHAKWKFDIRPEKFGIYVYAGPVFSVGMSSRSHYDLSVSFINVEGTYNYFNGDSDFNSGYDALNDIIKAEIVAAGLKYSRFEARLDCGVGFVIRDRHEIVTACDFGLNNRLKGAITKGNYMIVSNIYLGYRYRFGTKKH